MKYVIGIIFAYFAKLLLILTIFNLFLRNIILFLH